MPDRLRRTSSVAVIRCQVLVKVRQIKKAIDAAKQVILWNVVVKVKGVEQLTLIRAHTSHHGKFPIDSTG